MGGGFLPLDFSFASAEEEKIRYTEERERDLTSIQIGNEWICGRYPEKGAIESRRDQSEKEQSCQQGGWIDDKSDQEHP